MEPSTNDPCGPTFDCSAISRRGFLVLAGAAVAAPAMRAYAGPFTAADLPIPADKKLDPEWVKSLFARGERTRYTKARGELEFIGLPIGGVCCGTLYLGGDGKLWLWDIFNDNRQGVLPSRARWTDVGFSFADGKHELIRPSEGAAYVRPHVQQSPLEQGFAIRIVSGANAQVRSLDTNGFSDITFTGEYPIGFVDYRDASCPASVSLTAFSPFVPLDLDASSLPATVMTYTLHNEGRERIEVDVIGWLQNACSASSAQANSGRHVNRARRSGLATTITCAFEPTPRQPDDERADIVLADFEGGYGDWRVEGDAFGSQPIARSAIPAYQGDVRGAGDRIVNSHASAPGDDIAAKDARVGRLLSPPFRVERKFLSFWIGGGRNAEQVGLHVLVDGKVVRTATGHDANAMRLEALDVSDFEGQDAVIDVYDRGTGGWGNIGVDRIVQTDHPARDVPIEQCPDWGTMALALLDDARSTTRCIAAVERWQDAFTRPPAAVASKPAGEACIGALCRSLSLDPGESRSVSFVIAWHFANTGLNAVDASSGNHYKKTFRDAAAVVDHITERFATLAGATKLWHDTWYDSTLPHWFLERTFVNTAVLATSTAHRFATGRFWGWEGIGCCEGTCTHVWHYAQAIGRLFPELERDHRERVDFGVALDAESGAIGHRGERTGPAVDGQAGRILGVLREHQMSANDAFLRRIWPRVKRATEFLLQHDRDRDGVLDGAQENTLDAAWFGQIAWTSTLYLAALRAAEHMALELGDEAFARACGERIAAGKTSIEARLWNGEYFIQLPEPGREGEIGTYRGCHIDQVFGEGWLRQVALARVLEREKTRQALLSLYRYNFTPDVARFRARFREGRPYALAGDGGLVMTTNPQDVTQPYGGRGWQSGYFNECMSGFEHQAASHMIAEGLVLEGLAITRAIHDRYHAAKRNPFNEIECSDHYARAMASYGSFVAVCGFEHHGPSGHVGFAPRITPENFRAAFVCSTGWGSYAQVIRDGELCVRIEVKRGHLRLKTLALETSKSGKREVVTLEPEVTLAADQSLEWSVPYDSS